MARSVQLVLDLTDPTEAGVSEGAAAAGCSPAAFARGLSAMQVARSVAHEPNLRPGRRVALLRRSAELRRWREDDMMALRTEAASGGPVEVMAAAMRRSPAWHAVYRAETARLLAQCAWSALSAALQPQTRERT